MANCVGRYLECELTAPFFFGQILIQETADERFILSHRDDDTPDQSETFRNAEYAIEIAKYDDAGNYRPLKTAPNLRHGWCLELDTFEETKRALNYFYPGRLAIFVAWKTGQLRTTALRETLARQSGMYRVAAKISDSQINDVVANCCRSDGGCLRTILWTRDEGGASASTDLPEEKFDPALDQAACCRRPPVGHARASQTEGATVPLLCQEACNLLVAECRKVVKAE
jgi:sirohydrochlorin cobaltochelatase